MKWGLSRWRQENVAPKAVSVSAGGFSLGHSVDKNARTVPPSVVVPGQEPTDFTIPKVKAVTANREDRVVENTGSPTVEKRVLASSPAPFVVPAGYRITGSMFCARPVEVRGELAGRLRATGDVTICSGGTSSGEIQARRIVVSGNASARIVARESISLEKGGRILAPLSAPTLSVAAGGTLVTDSISVGYESQSH